MFDEERGILVPEWKQPEPELEFTKEQRSRTIYAKKNPLRIMPRDKGQWVHRLPGTNRSVLRVHPEGVQIGTSIGENSVRAAAYFGLLFIAVSGLMVYVATVTFDFAPALVICMVGVAVFFLAGMFFIRHGLFSPPDCPVLFNKITRKVYVIPFRFPSFFRFWELRRPETLRVYQWDDVQARTYRRLDVPGGTVARTETTLQMLCTTPDNPKLVDLIVSLGFTGTWSDNEQVKLWEHIRRYMEEGGPPLQPGDELRKVDHSKLPQFPPEVIAAAGGPALREVELKKWTHPAG